MLRCGTDHFSRQVGSEAGGREVQFVNKTEAQKSIEHNESLVRYTYSNTVAPIYYINYSSGCLLIICIFSATQFAPLGQCLCININILYLSQWLFKNKTKCLSKFI